MNSQTFHWEIETILTQFADALNDIVIKRYNKDREPVDQIHVNFVYAPKGRTLQEIVNTGQHFKLPVICISPASIRRNPKRVISKIEGSQWSDTFIHNNSAWSHLLQPVPVDVTVNVSIIAKFQQDVDQILTNFIPYTDPYFVVSWKWPDIIPWADFEIRSHIHWNENVSFQFPLDIPATSPYRIIADTSFLIETWMFKNSPNPTGPIYVIDTSFTAVSAIDSYDYMKSIESIINTDYSTTYTVISARPQVTLSTPFISYVNQPTTWTATGYMLDYTRRFFISASNVNMFSSAVDIALSGGFNYFYPLSGHTRLSSMYLGFSGYEVAPAGWGIMDKNTIKFTLTPIESGFFDIITMNDAGYGQLTLDCQRPTTNPYSIGTLDYLNYVEYQYPCISGLEVDRV